MRIVGLIYLSLPVFTEDICKGKMAESGRVVKLYS